MFLLQKDLDDFGPLSRGGIDSLRRKRKPAEEERERDASGFVEEIVNRSKERKAGRDLQ